MNIIIPIKLIPDLVEELVIDESGVALDPAWIRWKLSEFDEHAIEQALLLAEKAQTLGDSVQVIVIALDQEGADEALYTAAAKGAQRLLKMSGDCDYSTNNHALSRLFSGIVKDLKPDLVLTGVQSHNDLDGALGPLLAENLKLPYVGYVSGVNISNRVAIIHKEYPGGLLGELEVKLPAVLGIQSAEKPPRYVAFSKIRQAMKTVEIEILQVGELDSRGGPLLDRIYLPAAEERATMIDGDVSDVANRLVGIFQELGVI